VHSRAVVAVAQRFDRRLNDMLRGGKVRLVDAEIDDIAALARQRRGARQHGKGVFLADPLKSRNRPQHFQYPIDAKGTLIFRASSTHPGCEINSTGLHRGQPKLEARSRRF